MGGKIKKEDSRYVLLEVFIMVKLLVASAEVEHVD